MPTINVSIRVIDEADNPVYNERVSVNTKTDIGSVYVERTDDYGWAYVTMQTLFSYSNIEIEV